MDFTWKEQGLLSSRTGGAQYCNYYQPAQSTPTTTKTAAPKATGHKPVTDLQDIKTDISLLEGLLGIRKSLDEERTEIWLRAVTKKMEELLDDVRCLCEVAELEKTGLLGTLAELKEKMEKAGVECGKVDEAMGAVLGMLAGR